MQVTSNKLPSNVQAPTSKSYANRAIILGCLNLTDSTILDLPPSKDVDDLIENLTLVGIGFIREHNKVTITNSFPDCEVNSDELLLPGSEGGTTIRFLLTLLCLGKRKYILPLENRMRLRPLEEQIKILTQLGAKIERFDDRVEIQGPLTFSKDEKIIIDCSDTTQFATSMLLIQKFYPMKLELNNIQFSNAYLEMTKKLCREFSSDYYVPVDFSSLSYIAAWSVLNQDILIENVKAIDENQADSFLFQILTKQGVDWRLDQSGLHIPKSKFDKPVEVDVSRCLDLFPTLAYLAMFSGVQFSFKNLKFLKDKESDRLKEVLVLFELFSQQFHYDDKNDFLETQVSEIKDIDQSPDLPIDHRIVMLFALIKKHLGGGKVPQYQAVNKSFSNFFSLFS